MYKKGDINFLLFVIYVVTVRISLKKKIYKFCSLLFSFMYFKSRTWRADRWRSTSFNLGNSFVNPTAILPVLNCAVVNNLWIIRWTIRKYISFQTSSNQLPKLVSIATKKKQKFLNLWKKKEFWRGQQQQLKTKCAIKLVRESQFWMLSLGLIFHERMIV